MMADTDLAFMELDPKDNSGWERIERTLPPCIAKIMQEFCSLKFKHVETLKRMLLCVEEALADPAWTFPKFHSRPNIGSLFSKYMARLETLAKLHLDSFNLVKVDDGTDARAEIEEILNRITLYADAMICNDQERQLWIRNNIPKETEQEDEVEFDVDATEMEQKDEKVAKDQKIDISDDDFEDEDRLRDQFNRKLMEDDDSDVQVEMDVVSEVDYVPTFNRRLGTVSAFNLSDMESDFEDPESDECDVPDYSIGF